MRRAGASFYAVLLILFAMRASARRVHARQAGAMLGGDVNASGLPSLPPRMKTWERTQDRTSLSYLWAPVYCQVNGCTLREKFCGKSKDGCETVVGWPDQHYHILKYERVQQELLTAVERELKGEIRRAGDLGGFIFNDLIWEDDWRTFPIGSDLEDHRLVRPIADRIMNTKKIRGEAEGWTRAFIAERAQEFFSKHTSFKEDELKMWNCATLHKILFDMDVDDIFTTDFEQYKATSIKMSVAPKWIAETAFDKEAVKQERNRLLEIYMDAMKKDKRGFWDGLEGRDLRFAADFGLTAMTSAGGVSIPLTIRHALAIIYGDMSPLPEEERVLKEETLWPFVYEIIRRYAPVTNFPYWSPDWKTRFVVNVGFALMNEDHWPDFEAFKLRDDYETMEGPAVKIGVAWAEQAMGPNGLTPDSRGCPARDLSMTIVTEFLRVMIPMQDEWKITEKAGAKGLKLPDGDQEMMPDFTITRGEGGKANKTIPERAAEGEHEPAKADDKSAAEMMERSAVSEFKGKPKKSPFKCPMECQKCCKSSKANSFKCIMEDTPAVVNHFKILGRICDKPSSRNSDKTTAKSNCKVTYGEIAAGWMDDIPSCGGKWWPR